MSLKGKLVVATRNPNKVREIKALFGDEQLEILSLLDFPDIPEIKEEGKTFRENAITKAQEVARRTACLTLADDSGLEVYALGGAPGVRSARFSGEKGDYEANNQKLLKMMAHLPEEKRGACFRCVVALVSPMCKMQVAEGTYEGRISFAPRGKNGFGYDPIFIDPASGKTFAELSLGEKNKVSHRARAMSKARAMIKVMLAMA
jgi:XTP/dITP diphosphohydrolase